MKNLTWQNPEQLFVAQELINKVKSKCCGIKVEIDLDKVIDFGLPEVDDRFSVWRVPLLSKSCERIGELVIDAITTFIDRTKTTEKEVLENRLLGRVDRRKHYCPVKVD